MSDYTPTTDEVETAFHEFASDLESRGPGTYPEAPEFADWREAMAGFRRWLAAHDAALRAEWEAEHGEPTDAQVLAWIDHTLGLPMYQGGALTDYDDAVLTTLRTVRKMLDGTTRPDASWRTVQDTPTDDEREALAELLRRVSERENPSWLEDADALLTAGFRRTVQGEPTDAIPDDDQIAADNADWHTEYTEPQGEASDVQVDAALRAYYKEPRGDWVNQFGPNMRAALRAAAAVREEGQGR